MIVFFRRTTRLTLLALHIVLGIFCGFAAWLHPKPERVSRFWFRGVLRILKVDVRIEGQASPDAALLAGNHISWLDIAVLVSAKPVLFVSKAEVAKWPIIGWMARCGDTQFIERGAHGSAQINQQLEKLLSDGRSIVIFPEGTTTDGQGVRRFQPRLFAGAIGAQRPVQAFCIQYKQASAPYIGDQSLAENLWAILAEPQLNVRLSFAQDTAPGESRDDIARHCQNWAEAQLGHA